MMFALSKVLRPAMFGSIPEGRFSIWKREWQNVLDAEPNTANAEAIRNLKSICDAVR